jgi:hypothetical protein
MMPDWVNSKDMFFVHGVPLFRVLIVWQEPDGFWSFELGSERWVTDEMTLAGAKVAAIRQAQEEIAKALCYLDELEKAEP